RCSPASLAARAAAAGVTILGVTDHDTVGAADEAAAACASAGIGFVPGIEITAVSKAVDVHVLGYWLDVRSPALQTFLEEQRRRRVDRLREIVARLATFGIALDADALVQPALVAAGHVASTGMAFDQWLSRGRPAFVPRLAAAPKDVFARIHDAGGLASLAHPGLLRRDEWIAAFARDGIDAIEA